MIRREFIEALKTHGLAHHWENIRAISQPTIRLQLVSTAEEDIATGSSKMGGNPDLPLGYQWPTEQNPEKPLSFIAQINLNEVSDSDAQELLPKAGILYFFYSADQEAWGYDSKDADKFKVLYYEGDNSLLKRIPPPEALEEEGRFETCALIAQQEISLPSYGSNLLEFLTEEEQETVFELFRGNINKMLGYADTIQSEMELECELVTNGLYCGDPSGYNDPRAKELEPNAVDWRLLLQVDSNEDENRMMWGDGGRLYFWIKEHHLLAKNFDKSWVILQCY